MVDDFGIPVEAGVSYPDEADGRELLDIYYGMTPDDQGSDRVERRLREINGPWALHRIPISQINFHDSSIDNPSSKKLVKKYSQLTTDMPPVIASWESNEFEIIDGFHRIATAKALGHKDVLAYIPAGEEEFIKEVDMHDILKVKGDTNSESLDGFGIPVDSKPTVK